VESKEYYLKIASAFDEIREKFTRSEELIMQSHSDWDFQDARRVIFRKIIQMLNGFGIGFSHIHREFINPSWFNALYPEGLNTKENQKKLCNEFEIFLGSGIIIFLYGAVESSMRIISQRLDSSKYGKNTNFSSLYEDFLTDLNLTQYIDLLRLWGFLRNTIHNNGVFLPYNGEDQIVKFHGVTYKLENGKQHPMAGWEIYASLVGDLCEMVSSIVESKEIISIKEIPDSSTIKK